MAKHTYTEVEAAAVLDIPRSTLNWSRRNGRLRLSLLVSVGGWATRYDADAVDRCADEGVSPFIADDRVPPAASAGGDGHVSAAV